MSGSLLSGVRILIRADSNPIRQALFARLLDTNLVLSLVYRLHRHLGSSRASSLLVSCYGLLSYLSIAAPTQISGRLLTIAVHENARSQVERVASWFGSDEVRHARMENKALFRISGLGVILSLLRKRCGQRAFRIIHRFNRRYDFLVSCRVARVLACYARAVEMITRDRPGAILVSSDSNPEEIGFSAAAHQRGVPTFFIPHAYTTPISPPLNFSLSLLEGEASVEAYRKKGEVRGKIFLLGLEGNSASLDSSRLARPNPIVGIFTPKVVAWSGLAKTIQGCKRRFGAREVIIRWHPSMLERSKLSTVLSDFTGVTESPATDSLPDVAKRCDWVIADPDSNVHLPVLKLGIPTVSLQNLGVTSKIYSDLYGYVKERIIPPPVSAIEELSVEVAMAFFSEGWTARFRRYDAAYLCPQHIIQKRARKAVRQLLARSDREL